MIWRYRYFLIFFIFIVFFISKNVFADSGGVTLTVTISQTCGNGVAEGTEQCDGSDLAGATCVSRGYTGGSLSCNSNCTFNVSSCTSAAPVTPSGGGGGGGGGGGAYIPPSTSVVFSGRAYPKSAVTLLKDAQVAASTIAGPDSNFTITLNNLSAGNYIFSIYGEDKDGIRSSLFTFSVSVTAGVTTNVGGIFIAPTIAVDKSEVKRGDDIAIFGQAVSLADVIISVNSDEEFFGKIVADKDGVYLYNFDTSLVDYGTHSTKSKTSIANQSVSSWSQLINFKVGTKNVLAQKSIKRVLKGDVNSDSRVNLIDFSIAAYWYKRALTPAFKIVEAAKLNGDGKVDLVDFSIMAFYWTG